MGEMAELYNAYDDDILDYEQCEFCGKYLREYEVDVHVCLNSTMMRQIVDERIKWLMKRKQEKHHKRVIIHGMTRQIVNELIKAKRKQENHHV